MTAASDDGNLRLFALPVVDALSTSWATPLARIQSETDLLRSRRRDDDEREGAHAVIDATAGSMADIIDDAHAHPTGAACRHPGSHPHRLRPRSASRRDGTGAVTVSARTDPDLAVAVDSPLLKHLLGNAVRHARASVEFVATATAEGVEIVVTDDGPGVPPSPARRQAVAAGAP